MFKVEYVLDGRSFVSLLVECFNHAAAIKHARMRIPGGMILRIYRVRQ